MAANGSSTTNTSGESNVGFDFSKKGGSDCISDKNMAEIVRRMQGFITSSTSGDVIFSENPPQSKLKLWVQIDGTGAIIGGKIYSYDSDSGEWIDGHTVLPDPFEFKSFIETKVMGSDDETIVFAHNFGTNSYGYNIKYTSAPLDTARWYQVNKATNNLEIKVLGASGVSVEVTIIEIIEL